MNISKKETLILKAVSALFVLINHMVDWLLRGVVSDVYVIEFFGRLSDVGMFLFLFMSGYGLYKSYRNDNLDGYWEKKIERIYIPLLFANIIGALTYHLILNHKSDRAMILFGIISKEFIIYNPVTWYLHYLFYWYLIFWIIHRFVKHQKCRIVFLCIFSAVMWYFTPETYGLANEYCLAFFLGGIISIFDSAYQKNLIIFPSGIVCFSAMVVWFRDISHSAGLYTLNFFVYSFLTNLFLFVSAMMIIYIVKQIVLGNSKASIILCKLGEYSLGIYLLQEPVIKTAIYAADDMLLKIIFAAVGFFICIFLSDIYKRIVKKLLIRTV